MDKFLLTVSVLPVAAAIGGFYYFDDQALWVRVGVLLVALFIAGMIALQTQLGKAAWTFRREAIIEMRKVVWPTRKETVQTTTVVLIVVMIVAVLLWLLDMFLAWAIRFLTA